MEWMWEEVQKLDRVSEDYLEKLERWKKELRPRKKQIFGDRLERIDEGLLEKADTSSSYVAVDSAFVRESYLHADLYFIAAVAVGDRFLEDSKGCVEVETAGAVEEDEERAARLLEGLAFSTEVLLAREKEKSYRYLFLDGSLYTFLIKLNSAFSLVLKADSSSAVARKLRDLYPKVTQDFHYLLKRVPVVAVPKAFKSGNEELNAFLRERLKKDRLSVNAYVFLDALLDEGEYVCLEGTSKAVSYAGDYEHKREMLDLINRRRVFYMKGFSGRIFKFECVKEGHFDPEFFYLFTAGKEFLPLEVADKDAKTLLGMLKSRLPFQEGYR